MLKIKVYTDGGARGNPGPAGIGAIIYDGDDKIIHQISQYIGKATNNQAEYQAAIEALKWVSHNCPESEAEVNVDSELLARQFHGVYRVKDENLKKLYLELIELSQKLGSVSFKSIPRSQNSLADKLVNEAIDKAGK